MRRKQRNYLIAGLCMVLVVMAVGYAVFSQQLRINGTSQITSNWCLGFDSDNTSTYTVTNGGGTAPTGSISFSGAACESKYVPGATLSASFTTPGDSIEYTLTIKNAGTVDAAIKSIMVGEDSLTSDTTKQMGNIIFTIKMPEATSIAANGTTTMKVIATFQNEEDITGGYTGERQSIEIKINAEQDDGNGGFVTTAPTLSPYSGTIYRFSFDKLAISGSQAETSGTSSSISGLTEGVDYAKSAEALKSINAKAANYYLKHTIVNDKVTESYVCFVTDTEHCMQGGDSSFYKYNEQGGNWAVLSSQESWFQNQDFRYGENGKGSCSFSGSDSGCDGGAFSGPHASSDGDVSVDGIDGGSCSVGSDGNSDCYG